MRRYKKTYLRSFANGLVLAGLPVMAFFGADYLLAPPASEALPTVSMPNPVDSQAQRAAGAVSQEPAPTLRLQQGQPLAGAVHPAAASVQQTLGQAATSTNPPKSGLVAAIQQELQRVGCYAGDVDGSWNDRTRVAMQAFNSSVHVNLPIGHPDYILLTLLQGHSSKACARSCDGDAAKAGICIDRTNEARAVVPQGAARSTAATGSPPQGTWTSTVILAAPGRVATEVLAPGPAPTVRSVGGMPGKVAGTDNRAGAFNRTGTEASRTDVAAVQSESPSGGELDAQLAGRMAIGVLPPPTVAPAPARPLRADVRREAPTRVRASSQGGSRLGSTFTDLGRSSP